MANITQLKQEILFNQRLGGLLDALKSIAAQQFQMLERTLRSNLVFFDAIQTIAGIFNLERMSHPFAKGDGPMAVIAVTSDTGLLGGLNQQVIGMAVQEFRRNPGEMLVIGERGIASIQEARLPCHPFSSTTEGGWPALAAQVRDYALGQVLAGRFGELSIVHPMALSFTVQRIELIRVLPCTEWLRTLTGPRDTRSGDLLMESSVASVLEYLVWLWLGQKMVDVLGMSRLAEFAARSVHLEGSSQELSRRGKKLQLRYFRERRELIDRNIRELAAAKSLYGGAR